MAVVTGRATASAGPAQEVVDEIAGNGGEAVAKHKNAMEQMGPLIQQLSS